MASGSAWFFPPAVISGLPNSDARTQSIAPYGRTKMAVAGFASGSSGASLFTFDTQAQTWGVLRNSSLGQPSQYVSTGSTGASGLSAIDDNGLFTHYTSGGAVQSYAALGGGPYSSVLTTTSHGDFAVTYGGYIYQPSSGTQVGALTSTPGSNAIPQASSYNNDASYLGLIPALDIFGTANNAGTYSGTLTGPSGISTLATFATSGTSIVAGGFTNATQGASGQNFFALNPVNTNLLLAVSNTYATVLNQLMANSNVWQPATQLGGITGAAKFGSWSLNGTQAFLSDSTNGHLQILNYITGSLSIAQTLTLANIGQICPAADGTSLLACAPNQVVVFQLSGSTWSQTATLSVSGSNCLASLGSSILVGGAGGISVLAENAGVWNVASMISTGFTPTAITVDTFGNVYAASATQFAAIQGGAVVGTGAISGSSAVAISAFNSQVAIVDSTAGVIRVMGSNDGVTWSQMSSVAIANAAAIYQASASVFISLSSGAPYILNWDAPYTLVNAKNGSAGVYNGSTWSIYNFGIDKVPSAAAFDGIGNAWIACDDNSLYALSATATLNTTSSVPNYPGETTKMGVSSLSFSYGHIYAGCSMFGGLVQVQ